MTQKGLAELRGEAECGAVSTRPSSRPLCCFLESRESPIIDGIRVEGDPYGRHVQARPSRLRSVNASNASVPEDIDDLPPMPAKHRQAVPRHFVLLKGPS